MEDSIITKQLEVSSEGGTAIKIDQNGDAIGLDIDSEGTTASMYALNVVADQGAQPAFLATDSTNDYYKKKQPNSSDGANYFYRSKAAADTAGPVIKIKQNHASDDQEAVEIIQNGDNSGILITTVTAKGAPLELTPQAAPPATAREGMIYMDTDHHLYVHNGTTWVQLDN